MFFKIRISGYNEQNIISGYTNSHSHPHSRSRCQGFSLIELVIFIVVIGVAVTGVFLAFSTALQKSPVIAPQTIANQLAAARMDIIIGQRRMVGYSGFTDPCVSSPPAVCTVPAGITGYTITSTISAYTVGSDANYKIIDVLVTGPQSSRANLKTYVASY